MQKKLDWGMIVSEYAIILIFGVLFIFMAIFAPNFLTTSNLINILRQVSISGICAVGMTFVMLTGGIGSAHSLHRDTAYDRHTRCADFIKRTCLSCYWRNTGIRIQRVLLRDRTGLCRIYPDPRNHSRYRLCGWDIHPFQNEIQQICIRNRRQ